MSNLSPELHHCKPPSEADKIVTAINDLTGEFVGFRKQFARLTQILSSHGTGRRVRFNFAFGLPRQKQKAHSMIEVTITNEQEIDAGLKPVTDTGTPAPVQNVVWTVIAGDSTVSQTGEGENTLAVLRSSDTPGDTDFLVEGDADMGDGVEKISDIVRLHVSGARAKNLGLSLGVARAKSPA